MKVGCLGAGQLSLMLAEAARDLGIEFHVFASHQSEPACQIATSTTFGSLQDQSTLLRFGDSVDVVSFESDFLPYDTLKKLKLKFVPDLLVIEQLSDKIQQKILASAAGISVSDFRIFESKDKKLENWLFDVLSEFKDEAVFKWAKGGYDGKGVHIYQGDTDTALQFLDEGLNRGSRVFVEKRIKFRRELAQISTRGLNGDWVTYPLVISEQVNGVCRMAYGPAEEFGVSSALIERARAQAKEFAESINLVGTFALELFEVEGKLVLNEVAPRVHNTGHFSLTASKTSQFENHLKALTKRSLSETTTSPTFFMLNLLGGRTSGEAVKPSIAPPHSGVIKWYNKLETRPGRKLGHVNWSGFPLEDFETVKSAALEWETLWQK